MQKVSLMLFIVSLVTFNVNATDLYVDKTTNQVFTVAGDNRDKLEDTVSKVDPQNHANIPRKNWTDAITVRGYTQFRYEPLLQGNGVNLSSPGDKYISNNQGFGVRRARLIFFGDITDHLYWYAQTEFNATPVGVTGTGVAQVRDAYADISFDDRKEHRVRVGISKVPFGFEILQSSQNRLGFDRADAINSASRDERDMGVTYMWAPAEIRDRFRDLVRSGLKGSGDFGVVAFSVYNGQGLNRLEVNDSLHTLARVSYPFKFASGQFFEAGMSAFTGKFVPTRASGGAAIGTPTILGNPFATTATGTSGVGLTDQRVGVHAVYYPQPFGMQAEWNTGTTSTLDPSRTNISARHLGGGYVQSMYRTVTSRGAVTPYVKWQKFDGAERSSDNSPFIHLKETEIGVEWQPRPELELTVAVARMDRTNPGTLVQAQADLIRMQLQWNY